MNCRPGDLAVVVKTRPGGEAYLGRICRVLTLAERSPDLWRVEYRGEGDWYALDENLRPIRDPGDDATDETLDWLPVPHKETA